MRNEIPLDSATIAAVRGVTIAAANMEGELYSVAVQHWTHGLTRDELVEVIVLLGVLLTMPTTEAV
ncbi:hypothetical protein [Mycobacterium riyadhense]|uniref:Uncharacterized protein n=2 Tax=Mycobacterium riyadhense TaxID=486698 RepID=A0A1X2DHL8_9MYCO|nr:hypothetical protein [Mycobacterium riyadhense]MCV7146341.1 hypothetical protein [Mycobacterium riyadhense]ORW87199.1 hypothetical protein AWC22_09550 [Mycobacterium riyadhense]VTO94724.1 hypothetical protein BIN_B_00197 [Mycobacterium riyadhense]